MHNLHGMHTYFERKCTVQYTYCLNFKKCTMIRCPKSKHENGFCYQFSWHRCKLLIYLYSATKSGSDGSLMIMLKSLMVEDQKDIIICRTTRQISGNKKKSSIFIISVHCPIQRQEHYYKKISFLFQLWTPNDDALTYYILHRIQQKLFTKQDSRYVFRYINNVLLQNSLLTYRSQLFLSSSRTLNKNV